MFGRRQSRADRVRHDARSLAQRGIERGRHRAEALRDALPEPLDIIADLREQAEPVIRAAREQVDRAPAPPKKSRSKKPLLVIALAVVGAVVAYLLFSKRDNEPAYLVHEPDAPDESPAEPSSPGGVSENGSSPDASPGQPSSPVNGEEAPERASAFMASQLAQPTQASSSSMSTSPREPQATAFQALEPHVAEPPVAEPRLAEPRGSEAPSPVASAGMAYEPRAQVAAWDLPPSSVPPMRGGSAYSR